MKITWVKLLGVLAVETAILTLVYLYQSMQVAGVIGLPLDDSWIHSVFARNIAEGHGFVYNLGSPMSSTSVLYTLLLAALYKLSMPPVAAAIALGLALHIGTSLLVYFITLRLTERAGLAAAAAVVCAAIPRLFWGALTGMEVGLYVFLVTLGLHFHISPKYRSGWRAYLSTLAFALSALARPECAMFVVLALADRLITARKAGEKGSFARTLRTVPVHLLLAVCVWIPWIAFNLSATGLPLPPAFYAKTAPSVDGGLLASLGARIVNVPSYLWQILLVSFKDNWVLAVLMLPGLFLAVKERNDPKRAGVLILPIALIAIPAATALVARISTCGYQMLVQNGRYSAYLVPLMVVMGAMGAAWLHRVLSARGWQAGLVMRVCAAGVFLVLLSGNCYMMIDYACSVQNINAMQVNIGKWAAKLPRGTVVAANDIGAIAYFSRLPIVDTVGIVNPEVIPYVVGEPGDGSGLAEYLAGKKPEYVVIFPRWYPNLSRRDDILTPVRARRLRHNVMCADDIMMVYRARWP